MKHMYTLVLLQRSGQYGNTDCRVLKRGIQKLERFLPKNQNTKRKRLNFENCVVASCQKLGIILKIK